jgi:hypothetical protein
MLVTDVKWLLKNRRIVNFNFMVYHFSSGDGATGWMIGARFSTGVVSRPTLGSFHSPIQGLPGTSSSEVKRPGHEAGHLCTSTTKVKNTWNYTATPPYMFTAYFTFYFKLRILKFTPLRSVNQNGVHKLASLCDLAAFKNYLSFPKLFMI